MKAIRIHQVGKLHKVKIILGDREVWASLNGSTMFADHVESARAISQTVERSHIGRSSVHSQTDRSDIHQSLKGKVGQGNGSSHV